MFSYTQQPPILLGALRYMVAVWTELGTKWAVVTGRVNVVAAVVAV